MNMLNAELLSILACPACKAAVKQAGDRIVCSACAREYPIRGTIPVMILGDVPAGKEVQMNKMTYERVAEHYGDLWEELESWQVEERRKFAEYVGKDSWVLDLGCGPGRDVQVFTDLGLHCVGVDVTTSMLDLAQQRPHKFLVQMDMRHLAFRESVFDGVWACVSLIHLPREEIAGALDEIRMVLRDKGIFFVSMHAGQGEEVVTKQIYGNSPMFITYYEFDEFSTILSRSGFKTLETDVTAPWVGEVEKHKKFITFYTQVEK